MYQRFKSFPSYLYIYSFMGFNYRYTKNYDLKFFSHANGDIQVQSDFILN